MRSQRIQAANPRPYRLVEQVAKNALNDFVFPSVRQIDQHAQESLDVMAYPISICRIPASRRVATTALTAFYGLLPLGDRMAPSCVSSSRESQSAAQICSDSAATTQSAHPRFAPATCRGCHLQLPEAFLPSESS